MIRLRVLGATDLRGHDGHVVLSVLSQPKRLALLVYLALNATGRFVRREKLLALFWPESEAERARASLRRALSFLRKSLGTGVIVTRGDEEVGISPDALQCDAVQFDAAVDGGDFEVAWRLYEGLFLDGVHVSGSPSADRWLDDERSRLERRAADAGAGLGEEAERAGDPSTAARWAREALTLEPHREERLRRVMELLALAGDCNAALTCYDEFAARLETDLESEPSAETRDLARAIRARAGNSSRPNRPDEGIPTFEPGVPEGTPHPGRYSAPAVKPGRSGGWRLAALGLGAVAVTTSAAAVVLAGVGTPRPITKLNISLPDSLPLVFVGDVAFGVGQPSLALSPDAQQLVFVGPYGASTRLYLRSATTGQVTPLSGTEGASAPFFSRDGEWIGFFAGQHLRRVSSDGEQVQPLIETEAPLGGTWAEDGRVAAVIHDGRPLALIPPGGGDAELFHPDRTLIAHPFWLPETEWILLTCYDPKHLCAMSTSGELRHLTLDGPAVSGTGDARLVPGSNPRFVPPAYLVYSAPARNALLGILFDPQTMTTRGESEVVYDGVRREAFLGSAQASLSASGDLVLARGTNADEAQFVWVDGEGVEESVDIPPRVYGMFYLADDGRHLAALAYPEVGRTELWVMDVELGGRGKRWIDDGLVGDRRLLPTAWLPDSEGLLVVAFGKAPNMILELDPSRPTGGTVLWSGTERAGPVSVGADGRILMRFQTADGTLLSLIEAAALSDLSAAPSNELTPIIPPFAGNTGTALSPDGEWLAYHSQEAGPYHVYVVRTDGSGAPIRVSATPGEVPLWSPRGDGLYYRYGHQFFWVPFTGSADEPFGEPELFLEGSYLNVNGPDLAVSPDGSRLLLLRPNGKTSTSTLDVTLNFRARLAELLGGS
ncbi:MAG: hypothetical protein HKN73_11905 [Gemmatimonadetes bacterium]|nr:hypothetical protein [Gemmatimonadota bacterium]